MFSRFAVALRYNDAPSRIALTNVLTAGFKHLTREHVHHLETVANVSDYLSSINVLNNFDGIMAKRQFRFFLEQGHAVVSSRKTAAGEEQWFAISGYALFTPIFKSGLDLLRRTQSSAAAQSEAPEEKKATPASWRPSVSGHNDKGESSDSSSSESESVAGAAADKLKEQLSFFRPEVQVDFDIPQWRFSDEEEKEHQVKLVAQYRKRIKAVEDFWGLTEVDRADLERMIKLIENPMPDDDDETSKLDPAAWGLPFLSEPGASAPGSLRKPADDQRSGSVINDGDSDSSSDSESESKSDSDVCDAANLDVGEYVICRPAQGAEEQFWIGQVIADPKNRAGSQSGRVSVHWLEQTNRFTKTKRPFFKLAWTITTTSNRRGSARRR